MSALSQDESRSGKNGATDYKLTVAISFEIAVSKNRVTPSGAENRI